MCEGLPQNTCVNDDAPLATASTPLSPDDFAVCIHRGTRQIGGTCVELACRGECILLDLGLPLDGGKDDPTTLLPAIPGVQTADPSLLALVVSHSHTDHWGLVAYAPGLPIVAGAATRHMLRAAAAFVPHPIPEGINAEGQLDLSDRPVFYYPVSG
jgi:ribonuclease J